ncbi:cob(I)yrinic acid a,c-diamide adenosyltransferase [Pokkaliibacter sp. CJK22405]|uniref:cob(I)yrinic acid a,c-diamide adenosyltransferase n=1 Tax=Pokkaliibacter sp. CJK22405 TaxID=3384615 RepID=UPI0039855C06
MTEEATNRAERHKARMQKMKAHVDSQVAQATEERGIIVLLTGNGKGKSSSAFGMVARALGHGQRVAVVQFIKGGWDCGEQKFFMDHPRVSFHVMATGFTWETQNRDSDTEAAQSVWEQGKALLQDESIDLVIFDEMTYMFKFDYLSLDEVLESLQQRPHRQNVVITGRGAQKSLIELADTVTELGDIKHAFRAGIKAQQGIEF